MHSVILSRKAELDQFAVGFGPVLGVAMKYPDMMMSMFVSCSEPTFLSVTPAAFKEYFLDYIEKEGRTYSKDD